MARILRQVPDYATILLQSLHCHNRSAPETHTALHKCRYLRIPRYILPYPPSKHLSSWATALLVHRHLHRTKQNTCFPVHRYPALHDLFPRFFRNNMHPTGFCQTLLSVPLPKKALPHKLQERHNKCLRFPHRQYIAQRPQFRILKVNSPDHGAPYRVHSHTASHALSAPFASDPSADANLLPGLHFSQRTSFRKSNR